MHYRLVNLPSLGLALFIIVLAQAHPCLAAPSRRDADEDGPQNNGPSMGNDLAALYGALALFIVFASFVFLGYFFGPTLLRKWLSRTKPPKPRTGRGTDVWPEAGPGPAKLDKAPESEKCGTWFVRTPALSSLANLFGPPLRNRWTTAKLTRTPQPSGPGFGFDGLSKMQLKALRDAEEKQSRTRGLWFARRPEHPPSLPPAPHLPLPPMEIQVPEPTHLLAEETHGGGGFDGSCRHEHPGAK
jgi:hypothetical protein